MMRNKITILTVIIILIIYLGIGTCLFYSLFYKSKGETVYENNDSINKPQVTKPTDEHKVIKFDFNDARDLINNLYRASELRYNCSSLEMFTNNEKIEAKDIPSQVAYDMVISDFVNEKYEHQEVITLNEINKSIQKRLGKDYIFIPTEVADYTEYSCFGYVYDEAVKTFNFKKNPEILGCGGTCGYSTLFDVKDSYIIDDILYVNVRVIFRGDGYYSDYEKTNYIGTVDDYDSNYFDKGSSYQFTFNLENGNYVFVSSGLLAN